MVLNVYHTLLISKSRLSKTDFINLISFTCVSFKKIIFTYIYSYFSSDNFKVGRIHLLVDYFSEVVAPLRVSFSERLRFLFSFSLESRFQLEKQTALSCCSCKTKMAM